MLFDDMPSSRPLLTQVVTVWTANVFALFSLEVMLAAQAGPGLDNSIGYMK